MVFGFVGSRASAPTFSVGVLCQRLCQLAPPSSLLQTPPPAAPTQIISGLLGWATMQVMRPPIFVGPALAHCAVPASGGLSVRARLRSCKRSEIGASRHGQDSLA